MKITIDRSKLLAALQTVGRAIAGRSTMPVLGNVHIETAGSDAVEFCGTNLGMSISTIQPAEVYDLGAVTLPAKLLTAYAAALPDGPVTISIDASMTAAVTAGSQHANIKGIGPSEFPTWQSAGELLCSMDRLPLMVPRVAVSAATDETRPVLTGVLWHQERDMLTLAAADGYRLAVDSTRVDVVTPPEQYEMVIPARALVEVARLADDGQAVNVYVDKLPEAQRVEFQIGKATRVQSALKEGRFPDYKQIIPPSHTTEVTISQAALSGALRTADLFGKDSANIVRLYIGPGGLDIASSSAEVGDSKTEILCSVTGDLLTIAFNARYLLAGLACCTTPDVKLQMTTPAAPGVLRMPDEPNWQYVIMPMHQERG